MPTRDDVRRMMEAERAGNIQMRRNEPQKEVVKLTKDKKFAQVKIIQEPHGAAEIGILTQTPERVRRIIDFMGRVERGEMQDLRLHFGDMDRKQDLWVFEKTDGNLIGTYKDRTVEIPAKWGEFKQAMKKAASQMPEES